VGIIGGSKGDNRSVAYVRTAEVAQLDIALVVVTSLKITLPQAAKRVAPVAAVRSSPFTRRVVAAAERGESERASARDRECYPVLERDRGWKRGGQAERRSLAHVDPRALPPRAWQWHVAVLCSSFLLARLLSIHRTFALASSSSSSSPRPPPLLLPCVFSSSLLPPSRGSAARANG
jgi:hypothetical protein